MNDSLVDVFKLLAEFLPIILPVVLIQWALMIFALIRLLRSEAAPKFMPKWAWILIIILINIIGPVIYLTIGRNDE